MSTRFKVLIAALLLSACSSDVRRGPEDEKPAPATRVATTRGGAIVLSRDERIAVVANRSAGVVTVFRLNRDKPLDQLIEGHTEIDMDDGPFHQKGGPGSEPWAAVIGVDDDTAFVISRYDQIVSRIVDLHNDPHIDGQLAVGSEPTAIAIAPTGNRAFVANWAEGTISVVITHERDFYVSDPPLDLNAALARTNLLGNLQPFLGDEPSRLGLAHPRALAMTDDGDDDDADETLYATEFFSVPRPPKASESSLDFNAQVDRSRQGLVYAIPLSDGKVLDPIPLEPVPNTGFADSNGVATGCFPNQLYAAAAKGNRLFVTSLCASPAGPFGLSTTDPMNTSNFKTLLHPSLFTVDTASNQELPDQRVVLTSELSGLYAADDTEAADETGYGPRMPLIPNDMAFPPALGDAPTEHKGCITAMGADALFCIDFDDEGHELGIGAPRARYIDLAALGSRASKLPIGVAMSGRRPFALVVSDNTQSISVADLESNNVAWVEDTAPKTDHAVETAGAQANEGRQFFATGEGVWSFKGQAWASCESCHPDGLSDGVTWFFARGPRRTISTAGTYYGASTRRVLLWTGNVDEVHDVEGIVRTVAGGVGAMLWDYPGMVPTTDQRLVYDGSKVPPGKHTSTLRNNLNSSVKELEKAVGTCIGTICDTSPAREWDRIDAYIRSVRSPQRPAGIDEGRRLAGARLFGAGKCASCHGGPGFTLSRVFYTPGATNNGSLPYEREAGTFNMSAPTPADLEAIPGIVEFVGRLRMTTYSVPDSLLHLNPPAEKTGTAPLRRWDPGDRKLDTYLYGTVADGYDSKKTHTNDQINCVLRAVGTYPSQSSGENKLPVLPDGSPAVVKEVRGQDMNTLAQGDTGFNIPSLVGIAAGAPYFHAGNARTLEEALSSTFAAHHQAFTPDFLSDGPDRATQIRALVEYLLSIDDNAQAENGAAEADLCPPPGQLP